jgi:ribulose bisphosphate carboxylase small subunit
MQSTQHKCESESDDCTLPKGMYQSPRQAFRRGCDEFEESVHDSGVHWSSKSTASGKKSGFEIVQELSDLADLASGDFVGSQGLDDEIASRTVEQAVHQISNKVLPGLICRHARFIDMTALAFLAYNEALVGHDLEEAKSRGVGKRLIAA